jgi:hypothetical protein
MTDVRCQCGQIHVGGEIRTAEEERRCKAFMWRQNFPGQPLPAILRRPRRRSS